VAFTRGEAMLIGAHIAVIPKRARPRLRPRALRKLLLPKRELDRLRGKRGDWIDNPNPCLY
jgi:tmRNA-binding protein